MKKADLEKRMAAIARNHGVEMVSDGGTKHDKFRINGITVMVPRHNEIGEMLAKTILKQTAKAAEGE